MGKYADIDAMCDEILSNLHRIANETLAVLERETKKEGDLALQEFGRYQSEKIRDLFLDAVQRFYDAYSPSIYSRTYGLADLLNIQTDSNGIVIYDTAEDLIDPSNMHTGRSGNSLFEKVYMHGWHGGAEDGPDHPAPGVPYYRAPYGIYARWSRPAVRTEPPHEIFRKALGAAESGEILAEFKRLSDRHNEIAMANVQRAVDQISRKYYG